MSKVCVCGRGRTADKADKCPDLSVSGQADKLLPISKDGELSVRLSAIREAVAWVRFMGEVPEGSIDLPMLRKMVERQLAELDGAIKERDQADHWVKENEEAIWLLTVAIKRAVAA